MATFVIVIAAAAANAQRPTRPDIDVDPKTAMIVGRIVFPTGHSIRKNMKVTLRNAYAPLFTIYSNETGEFRFTNLESGTYYVEVLDEAGPFDPITERILLRVGAQQYVTVYLREKTPTAATKPAGGVTSVAELTQEVPAPAKKEYDKALKLIRKGKVEQAIEHLERAINIFPDYHAARNDLGVQYMRLARTREAVEQFEAAIAVAPRAYNPRFNLGLVLVESKRYAEGLAELKQAIAIDNTRPAAYLYVGIALLETDDLVEAYDELRKALMLSNGEYPVAYYYMGIAKMRRGEREEAVRDLKAYLEHSPSGEMTAQARELLAKLE
jgi:tetratricopeptide (TPR) repeat protein